MLKNIFITGQKNTGKSTLLSKIIASRDIDMCGFRVVGYPANKNKIDGYEIRGLGIPGDTVNSSKISVMTGPFSCDTIISGFEQYGVSVLSACLLSDKRFVVMDELGVLEEPAENFKRLVHKLLDSDKFVLGVLKKKNGKFIASISGRSDTAVVDIDKINRGEALKKVLSLVDDYKKEIA